MQIQLSKIAENLWRCDLRDHYVKATNKFKINETGEAPTAAEAFSIVQDKAAMAYFRLIQESGIVIKAEELNPEWK